MRFMVAGNIASNRVRGVSLALAVLALSVSLRVLPVAADGSTAISPSPITAAVPTAIGGGYRSPSGGLFANGRTSFSQSITIGTSSGGPFRGTAGLYTASLGYRLANPLALRIDLGASFAPGGGSFLGNGSRNALFLQGLNLDWRPGGNSLVRFQYRDYRSPLQWGWAGPGYDAFSAHPFGDPSLN